MGIKCHHLLSTILNFFPLENLLALAIYLNKYILLLVKHKDIHQGKQKYHPKLETDLVLQATGDKGRGLLPGRCWIDRFQSKDSGMDWWAALIIQVSVWKASKVSLQEKEQISRWW